jgi:hypothetical protein
VLVFSMFINITFIKQIQRSYIEPVFSLICVFDTTRKSMVTS